MVPWVLAQAEPPTVDETCRRFGITAADLVADLELLFLCGIHPFTPDTMIEAWIDDDRVVIRSELFTRLPRPDPGQALALLAAGRAVAQAPGAPDALHRALEKLEAALPGEMAKSLVVDLEAPEHLETLREALDQGRRVEMEYFSYTRDALTERAVDPAELFARMGSWYLTGWCHLAGGPRLFRVDRVRRLRLLEDPAEKADAARGLGTEYRASEGDARVTIVLGRGASWVSEYYPLESDEPLPDGRRRVVLSTGSPAWLTRLVLRLGPEARVEDPPEVAEEARATARRVLARYGGLGA